MKSLKNTKLGEKIVSEADILSGADAISAGSTELVNGNGIYSHASALSGATLEESDRKISSFVNGYTINEILSEVSCTLSSLRFLPMKATYESTENTLHFYVLSSTEMSDRNR